VWDHERLEVKLVPVEPLLVLSISMSVMALAGFFGLRATAPMAHWRDDSSVQAMLTVPPPAGAGSVLPEPGVLSSAVPLVVRSFQRSV
jgi:hypothetical protein